MMSQLFARMVSRMNLPYYFGREFFMRKLIMIFVLVCTLLAGCVSDTGIGSTEPYYNITVTGKAVHGSAAGYGSEKFIHEHHYVRCVCACGSITASDSESMTAMLTGGLVSELGLDQEKNAVIPDTVQIDGKIYTIVGIGPGAFRNNETAEEIIMPDTVEYIGDNAFDGCSKLRKADLPDGITYIGMAAFQCCYALEEIAIPDSVRYIGNFAYNHCSSAKNTSIHIPDSLERIGLNPTAPAHAFYDCGMDGSFSEFQVDEENGSYKAMDGILYTEDGRTLVAIPRGKEFQDGVYYMPDTVSHLGELAFSRNKNVKTLVLSDSLVVDLADSAPERSAFANKGNNLSISCYGYYGVSTYVAKETNPRYRSDKGILYSKDGKEIIAIPSQYTGKIDIPEGTVSWREEALWTEVDYFMDICLDKITAVTIPASMADIDEKQVNTLNQLADIYGTTLSVDADNPTYEVNEDGNLSEK